MIHQLCRNGKIDDRVSERYSGILIILSFVTRKVESFQPTETKNYRIFESRWERTAISFVSSIRRIISFLRKKYSFTFRAFSYSARTRLYLDTLKRIQISQFHAKEHYTKRKKKKNCSIQLYAVDHGLLLHTDILDDVQIRVSYIIV